MTEEGVINKVPLLPELSRQVTKMIQNLIEKLHLIGTSLPLSSNERMAPEVQCQCGQDERKEDNNLDGHDVNI